MKKARLASAYERTLDYKVGIRPSHNYEEEEHDASQLGNPTLSAWGGIAEAKIQQAIRQGLLKDVKGRGKPIPRDEAESNPFISRCVVLPPSFCYLSSPTSCFVGRTSSSIVS